MLGRPMYTEIEIYNTSNVTSTAPRLQECTALKSSLSAASLKQRRTHAAAPPP